MKSEIKKIPGLQVAVILRLPDTFRGVSRLSHVARPV